VSDQLTWQRRRPLPERRRPLPERRRPLPERRRPLPERRPASHRYLRLWGQRHPVV